MKSKYFAAIALILVLAVMPVLASQFTFNQSFNSDTVSVVFPKNTAGVTTEPQSGTTTDNVPYSGTMYSVDLDDASAFFAVDRTDYSTERDGSVASLDDAIAGGWDNANMLAVPDSNENTTLGGLFAREGEATSETKDAFLRVAVDGRHAYLAVVVFEKKLHATQDDADEFFNSIHRK